MDGERFVGILHMSEMILLMTYLVWRLLIPSEIRKSSDTVYFFLLFILVLSWMTFSDECLISLFYKKVTEKNEKSTADLKNVLGDNIVIFKRVYYICLYASALYLFIIHGLALPGIAFLFMMYTYLYWSTYDHKECRIMDERELEFLLIKGLTLLATIYAIVSTSLVMFK